MLRAYCEISVLAITMDLKDINIEISVKPCQKTSQTVRFYGTVKPSNAAIDAK